MPADKGGGPSQMETNGDRDVWGLTIQKIQTTNIFKLAYNLLTIKISSSFYY